MGQSLQDSVKMTLRLFFLKKWYMSVRAHLDIDLESSPDLSVLMVFLGVGGDL